MGRRLRSSGRAEGRSIDIGWAALSRRGYRPGGAGWYHLAFTAQRPADPGPTDRPNGLRTTEPAFDALVGDLMLNRSVPRSRSSSYPSNLSASMARPTLRGRAGLLASLALALFVGCGDREAPVGGLAVTPSTIDFAYPEAVEVEFAWTPTAALSEGGGRLRVFVHLVDSAGELIRTFDHGFPESWEPSSPVTYTVPLYQSAIGPALPPGSYGLEVGLYDESGKRWRLEAAEEQSNRAYRVAEVVVSDGAGALPTFTFSPGWLPEELGKDKQILVRRWLSEAGSVYASGVSEPGRLWIRLATPTGAVENHTLVLAEGESQPGVVVTGCDGRVERLAADEVRELTYEVAADCEISLSPNYYWQESETDVRRSLALEGVAWIR